MLTAAWMTTGMTLALTFHAFRTNKDFTGLSSLFFCLSVGLILLVISQVFMTFIAWWSPVVTTMLVISYGLFLIYDTQMVAGGGKYALSHDDYVVGALMIYVDILWIFLELLRLLRKSN